jgi:hypothetical protein
MPQLNVSEVFNTHADTLWGLLKDFGNLEAWWLKDSPIKIAGLKEATKQ